MIPLAEADTAVLLVGIVCFLAGLFAGAVLVPAAATWLLAELKDMDKESAQAVRKDPGPALMPMHVRQ